jgi:hypothetical protein
MAQPLIEPGEIIIGSLKNLRKHVVSYSEFVVWFVLLSLVHWAFLLAAPIIILDKTALLFIYLVFSIPWSLALLILTTGIIDLTGKALQKKKATVHDSILHGAHKFVPMVWVTILTMAAIAGGFLLFLIPALVFFVWYKFAVYHVAVDDLSGLKAMGTSRKLVIGRWWSVLLRIVISGVFFSLVVTFATSLVYLLTGALFGDPGLFFGPLVDLGPLPTTHSLFIAIIPKIIQGFGLPLFIAADMILWNDLKRTL